MRRHSPTPNFYRPAAGVALLALGVASLAGCSANSDSQEQPLQSPSASALQPATPHSTARPETKKIDPNDFIPAKPVKLHISDVSILTGQERRDDGDISMDLTAKSVNGKTIQYIIAAFCKNESDLSDSTLKNQNDLVIVDPYNLDSVQYGTRETQNNSPACTDDHQVSPNEAGQAVKLLATTL